MLRQLGLRGQIHRPRTGASRAKYKAKSVGSRLRQIHARSASPALASQAMRELVGERMTVSGRDIEYRMQKIDLRHGRTDGKMNTSVCGFPDCGPTVSHWSFPFSDCGKEVEWRQFFELTRSRPQFFPGRSKLWMEGVPLR